MPTVYPTVRGESVPRGARGPHATGALYSYWQDLPADFDQFYWGFRPTAAVGVIPTNDQAWCVFVSVPAPHFRDEVRGDPAGAYLRAIRAASPELDARLSTARRVEPVHGFGGQTGHIRKSAGPGWALVGDAAYFKDPLTAHGITDALRDAEFLARAIGRGTADALRMQSTRLDLSRKLFELTDEIVSFAGPKPNCRRCTAPSAPKCRASTGARCAHTKLSKT